MDNNFSHKPFAFLNQVSLENAQDKENISVAKRSLKSHAKKRAESISWTAETEENRLFLQAMHRISPDYEHSKLHRNRKKLHAKQVKKLPALTSIGDALNFSEIFPVQKSTASNNALLKSKISSHKSAITDDVFRENRLQSNAPQQRYAKEKIEESDVSMKDLLDAQELRAQGQSEEDMQAFAKAVQEVKPLPGKGRAVAKVVEASIQNAQNYEDFSQLMEKKVEFALSLKGEYLEGHVVGLDLLTMENLRMGRYSPEAHLDLHGLNANQAYEALVKFFRISWYKGMRTVLLVPGRGKNSPNGFSVLRDKLQLWLTQDPFKRVVLAFCTAKSTDGGAGTMYVLLRKYKKKGKINWERLPADPDLY